MLFCCVASMEKHFFLDVVVCDETCLVEFELFWSFWEPRKGAFLCTLEVEIMTDFRLLEWFYIAKTCVRYNVERLDMFENIFRVTVTEKNIFLIV